MLLFWNAPIVALISFGGFLTGFLPVELFGFEHLDLYTNLTPPKAGAGERLNSL